VTSKLEGNKKTMSITLQRVMLSRYLIRVESIYWRENWTFVSVTLTIFLIISSVSFSQCTMSPMLGLLFRSAWMQSSAISIALFTWRHSASSDVHLGVSSSLFLQFSSTYGFDKKNMLLASNKYTRHNAILVKYRYI